MLQYLDRLTVHLLKNSKFEVSIRSDFQSQLGLTSIFQIQITFLLLKLCFDSAKNYKIILH